MALNNFGRYLQDNKKKRDLNSLEYSQKELTFGKQTYDSTELGNMMKPSEDQIEHYASIQSFNDVPILKSQEIDRHNEGINEETEDA